MKNLEGLKIKSKALEANIASYHVDAVIDPKYALLQDIMSKYYGLMDGLNTFLKELSHPYRNWSFIVKEARTYSLDYFHLVKKHPQGPEAAALFIEIFLDAVVSARKPAVKADAADNFLLYIKKIIKDAHEDFDRFKPVLDDSFDKIRNQPDDLFFIFVTSYYRIKRVAEEYMQAMGSTAQGFKCINTLLIKYFQYTYTSWQDQEDPLQWFVNETGDLEDSETVGNIFDDISLERITDLNDRLGKIIENRDIDAGETLTALLEFDGYGQFVEAYRKIPQKLFKAGEETGHSRYWKLIFLFHIMNTSGLSLIHEETLRDINRTLTWLITHEEPGNVRRLIRKTFSILKERARDFPSTALNCVLNMGEGVYKTDDNDFVNFFTDYVIDLGFQTPNISGVGNDWQIKVNNDHIQNIRTWIKLIERKPQWSSRLLSALIIHLSVCGVFIKDTDLFPRDITRFLNCDIEPVYNLSKQLARLFPAFFNDIGAEGELREISTQIDEISHRKDVLIHFLRKQSHVESSNRIIDLMNATLDFWRTADKRSLQPFVPPALYNQIETEGPYINGVHRIMADLDQMGIKEPVDLLAVTENQLKDHLTKIDDVSANDRERVCLARSLYKLLYQKYNLNFSEMANYITQLNTEAFPDLNRLKTTLARRDLKKKIKGLLKYLKKLKKLILSPEVYEIREDIYQKRHITIDIPSISAMNVVYIVIDDIFNCQ